MTDFDKGRIAGLRQAAEWLRIESRALWTLKDRVDDRSMASSIGGAALKQSHNYLLHLSSELDRMAQEAEENDDD